jgi:dTDP-glucose 4,6-dehydratase
MKMSNNLYVISGAAGMTGNELVRQLVARGQFVVGFDNFFASTLDTIKDIINNNFVFFEYDINNKKHLDNIFSYVKEKKNKFDNIIYINCAAIVHTEYFYLVNSTFETNVLGMKSFLEQAISIEARQFINCSSSEIYSMCSFRENGGVQESDYALLASAEHSQRTSYATEKMLTEFFAKDAVNNSRIKACSIRFANVYSKNERFSKHIIPHILTNLYYKGEVELLENSKTSYRTFLYNYDSCAAVLSLSNNEESLDGSIYNVCTDEEVCIISLVKIIAEKLNIKNPKISFSGRRTADPARRLLNSQKIRKITGWKPTVSLSEGLDMCIAHMKSSL